MALDGSRGLKLALDTPGELVLAGKGDLMVLLPWKGIF